MNSATASLGVARLAITDVANGHQPLCGPSGSVGLNGAIYNYASLVDRFRLKPATGNDGEVIWPLYERFGLRFADHLEGMFAICIVDDIRKRVVVAVDPLGIKPLYLSSGTSTWFAASTLSAFPAHLRDTAFRVPAGSVVSSCGEAVQIRRGPISDRPLGQLLSEAVASQIPDEVPWGCLLSGGVDSSTVAAVAARHRRHVVTVTAGLPDSEDVVAARGVAQLLGTEHHEALICEDELAGLVDAAIRATGSPDGSIVMGGVGTYVAARMARRIGLKVLLSGEGADELFGGYPSYRKFPREKLNSKLVHDQRDLGATECLRLDRCTMAHGVEARVPFLSWPVVAKARALTVEDKLGPAVSAPSEKLALRRFAATVLPADIAWKPKCGFATGSGLVEAVKRLARREVSESALARLRASADTATFLRVQTRIGFDERVAAWTLLRWRELSGGVWAWEAMVERGLVRRELEHGEYMPSGFAPAVAGQG